MLDKKKIVKTIMIIIIIYTIIGIILPFVFKYAIFESTTFSNLSNSEWASFLGSYVGGILGGLGTLISVFITVKESRDMQTENKKDTDEKILEDKAEREKERKEDRLFENQRERMQFADDVVVYIGKYITHISNYYCASRWAQDLNSTFLRAKDELRKLENRVMRLDEKIDQYVSENDFSSDGFLKLDLERTHLMDKVRIAEREYNEILIKRQRNSQEGNRTEANECYFILKTKLYKIAEANELLSQLDVLHNDLQKFINESSYDWLGQNNDLLMKEYYKFKIRYVGEEYNNIPTSFSKQ